MKYYSTDDSQKDLSFQQAIIQGQGIKGGLFMPEYLPSFDKVKIKAMQDLTFAQIAYQWLKPFVSDSLTDSELREITEDSYNFPVPLESFDDNKFILNLDRGPTAAFKDFAARFLARAMNKFLARENTKANLLVATSGDTGSAVAWAFHGLENIRVSVLFPRDEVSPRQRKLMTTLGDNINPIAVDGKFDDCQSFVKKAFQDPDLADLNLTSANSINIGRLLPQSAYYIYSYLQIIKKFGDQSKVYFSVPSGNYGNLTAGLLAQKSGFNISGFIASNNQNNSFSQYLENTNYSPIIPSINSISNAMNVGDPNNIPRILELYSGRMSPAREILKEPDLTNLKANIKAYSYTDEQTINMMQSFYTKYNLVLEPHTAVGVLGLFDFFKENPELENATEVFGVVLGTASPAKFSEKVEEILNVIPETPENIKEAETKIETYKSIDNSYSQFCQYLKEINLDQ